MLLTHFPHPLSDQLAGIALERPPTPTVSHEEVLEVGRSKAEVMRRLVEQIIRCQH